MSNPGSHVQARMKTYALLARSLSGAATNRVRRAELAGAIAEILWKRWKVGPWQWKQKHLQWYLDVEIRGAAHWTRYHHWNAIRAVLLAVGKNSVAENLAHRANATYVRPNGTAGALEAGRPAKAAVRKRKN